MLEFLVATIFFEFGVHIFQQIIDILMDIIFAPLLCDIFPYSYTRQSFCKHLSITNDSKNLNRLISHSGILIMFYQLIVHTFDYINIFQIAWDKRNKRNVLFLDIYFKYDIYGFCNISTDSITKQDLYFAFINLLHLDSNIPTNPPY